ncbi:MAG: hypothetical protein VB862_00875, partial [Pirellulaceae bacterium]
MPQPHFAPEQIMNHAATRLTIAIILLLTCSSGQRATAEDINSLSDAEDKQNFKLLFDGKSMAGWQ